ncbi:hypothetical protein Bca4012_002497 [Brassica carinata]
MKFTCLLLTQPFLYNGYNSTGTKNWDSLLDPLDQSLRQLILRCGDFCQAATAKSSFFEKVILEHTSDYEVTSFLYATARRSLPPRFAPPLTGLLPRPTSADMLFRGPEQNGSGLKVVEAGSTYTSDSKDEEGYCKVMLGWLTIYTSDHPESSNLGATEAVLAAYYIAENDSSDDVPVTAIVFGCPQEDYRGMWIYEPTL